MSTTPRPYFAGKSPVPSNSNVAYIPVKVTKDPGLHGTITVYLMDGTALDVRASELFRLDAEAEAGARSGAPEQTG